jgi:hypothetical protein
VSWDAEREAEGVTATRVSLFDEGCACVVPGGVLLDCPVDGGEQVCCVARGEVAEGLRVEAVHHAVPGWVVAVGAAVDDEAPFRIWVGAEMGRDVVKVGRHYVVVRESEAVVGYLGE